MKEFTPILLIAFFVLLLYVFVRGLIRESKRRTTLEHAAGARGFSFDARPTQVIDVPFELMLRGHSRRVRNVMRGRVGEIDLTFFDYRFVTGTSRRYVTHHHTVVMLTHPRADLPAFRLLPEGLRQKAAAMLGAQDIDFDDDRTFSERFVLKGHDETAIRACFGRAARARFCGAPDRTTVEAHGPTFIMYRPRRFVAPEAFEAMLTEAQDLAEALWGEDDRHR